MTMHPATEDLIKQRLVSPEAEECQRRSLLKLYPEAVLVGHSVLHGNGWTTQPCRRIQLAVLHNQSEKYLGFASGFPQEGDFQLFSVCKEWFQMMARWIVEPDTLREEEWKVTTYGYRALLPAAAFVEQFADMREVKPHTLDPDDYDVDELFDAREMLEEISMSLGLNLPAWALLDPA